MIKCTKVTSRFVAQNISLPIIILAFLAIGGGLAAADIPDLVTDRPDQTESSVTIFPGTIQIETGVVYSEEDEHGLRSRVLEAPGTLFRIGVTDRIELRLGLDGWVRDSVSSQDGFGDSELGLKTYLGEESGWRPETALLTSLSLPTGDRGFSSERADPSFRLLFSNTITDRVSLGYNLGAAWASDKDARGDRDTTAVFQYTIAIGTGITDRIGAFLEFFGDVPLNARGTPANSFDGGITYLIRENLQFDISGGVGLSDAADDWFVGLGISYRYPQ